MEFIRATLLNKLSFSHCFWYEMQQETFIAQITLQLSNWAIEVCVNYFHVMNTSVYHVPIYITKCSNDNALSYKMHLTKSKRWKVFESCVKCIMVLKSFFGLISTLYPSYLNGMIILCICMPCNNTLDLYLLSRKILWFLYDFSHLFVV